MKTNKLIISLLALLVCLSGALGTPTAPANAASDTFGTAGSFNWTAPAEVTSITVQVWGGGGRGGSITSGSSESAGGGGGGGAFSTKTVAVTPGNTYALFVGAGSNTTAAGGDSYFIDASTVLAKGGNSVADNSSTAASGGTSGSGIGDTKYSGGSGANGSTSNNRGGGAGSSAGTGANGANGSSFSSSGGNAPTGGGDGGDGRSSSSGNGSNGSVPGGGGGGAYRSGGSSSYTGGNGANGKVVITYTLPPHTITATAGAGGAISPTGAVIVADGANQTFTITPSIGNIIADISVDSVSQGRIDSYAFTNVTVDHAISATFNDGWIAPNATIGSNSVTSPNNGWVSDNNRATFNDSNDTAEYGFPDLGIPGNAIIEGVEVAVEGRQTSSRDFTVALWNTSNSNPDAYTSIQTAVMSTASGDTTVLVGGSTNKWGKTWTAADFADATFKIRIGTTFSSGDALLDQVQIKVFYTLDTTAPDGGSITYTDGEYVTAAVPVTYTTGTDSGSGLNLASGKIQRASAVLADGTCGSFGDFADLATESDGSYTDNTVVAENCYKYQYTIADNAGNAVTYTSENVVKILPMGTIIVKKAMVGGTATFDFTGSPSGSISANNGTISAAVAPGQYISTETLVPGWDLTGVTCDDNDSVGSLLDHSATFNVANGETVICTFTNTKQTTLTVNKILVPASDTGKFNLQIDGLTQATDIGDGGTTDAQVVSIGAHTVGELAGTDTSLSDYTAVFGGACDTSGNVTLTTGQNAVCTITNTKKGKIVIQKNTVGGDAVFGFNLTGPTPAIPSVSVAGGSGSITLLSLPGAYHLTENILTSWSLTALSCDSGTPSNFTLPAGGTVTCTFNNTYQAPTPPLPLTCGLEVALTGDTSGSVDNFELMSLKIGLHNFANVFLPGSPAFFSVTDFDTVALIRQSLTNNSTLISAGIDALSNGGNFQYTNWEDALNKAQSSFDTAGISKLIVFVTDGDPTYKGGGVGTLTTVTDAVNAAIVAANGIKLGGTRIVAIGIGTAIVDNQYGESVNVNNLIKIAGNTVSTLATINADSDVITLDTFDDLPAAMTALAASVRLSTTATCGGTIIATKIIDADGNLTTTNDQTLTAGWQFNVAGQDEITGADGNTAAVEIGQGIYAVSETLPENYALINATCTSGANNGTLNGNIISGIQVGSLNAISCTFYNAPLGSITVAKNVVPQQSLETFNFTASGGLIPSEFTLQHGGTRTFSNLVPGSYGVIENANQNYQSAVACTDGVSNDIQSDNIQIGYNTNVTCIFTNSDVTGPVIDAHGDETAEATSASGATVSYIPPATFDAVDGAGSASCLPVSGSTFALGDTTVTCNAADSSGNPAISTTFKVTVTDLTAPVIAAHGDESVEATSPAGATVTYTNSTTTDNYDASVAVSCTPVSGSTFALGETTVTCSATDSNGNPAIATTFKVTIIDTTAPVITLNGVTADIIVGGAYTELGATASDIVDGIFAAAASGSVDTSVVGTYFITYNAADLAGNVATPVIREVKVVPIPVHTVSGTIKYYDGIKAVAGATITLETDLGAPVAVTTTDADGNYQFIDVLTGGNYAVRVTSSDSSTNGLTSIDQIKIGRHIVHAELFDSIYKIIAGDVNNSGNLSSLDQIKIGRFMVHLDSGLQSGTWKFYSSDAGLTEGNYLTTGLARIYTNLDSDQVNENYVGIKMGDVNNSWVNN